MATSSGALPGAERIRAIQDRDGTFRAFDSYPWTKDDTFMSGLDAILGEPNAPNPRGTPSELALHARIFYYAQRVGVNIDFTQYKEWLAENTDHSPPDVLPPEFRGRSHSAQDQSRTDDNVPSWQASAPKADLYVDKKTAAANASRADGAPQPGSDDPAYPMGFAEMLERIQKGEPIPGIREIPDTVIRDPTVKPFGTRTAPRKPWERDLQITENTDGSRSAVDSSFPALDDQA